MGPSEIKPLFSRKISKPSALAPLAKSLTKHLHPGTVVTLTGDLGTGKTTFVRAICKALGMPDNQVKSPSFTLVNEYDGPITVYHIDLYRLGEAAEISGLGLDEILDEGQSLCFIEWPGMAKAGLVDRGLKLLSVEIRMTGRGKERLVTIRRGY